MKGKKLLKRRPLPVMLWCRASEELAKQVDAEAEAQDRPRSWVIRQLLLRALAANEKTA